MVTAIVGVADVLRDMGLSSAAIQAKTISHAQQSNLFWLNSAVGLLLTVTAIAVAWPIAALYGDDRLAVITMAVAPMFLLNGVQTQFQAHLARGLRFAQLSISEVLSMILGLAAAIGLALLGFGYWALVGQLIVQAATLLIARALMSGWRPGLPDRREPTRHLVRYGGNLMASQLLVYASSNVPSVIIGSRFGASALGFYGRASQLVTFPMNQLFTPMTNVALPVLSRSHSEPEQFERHLIRAQIVLSYAVVGLLGLAIVWAMPIIPLIFGQVWEPSAPLFQVLAVAGAFQAVSYVVYWVFLAKGLTGSHFRYSIMSRSILIAVVLLGSFFGAMGVAVGYVMGVALGWPLSLFWLRRHRVAPIKRMFFTGLRVLTVGLVITGGGLIVSSVTRDYGAILQMATSGAAFVALACAVMFSLPVTRRDLGIVQGTVRHLLPGR